MTRWWEHLNLYSPFSYFFFPSSNTFPSGYHFTALLWINYGTRLITLQLYLHFQFFLKVWHASRCLKRDRIVSLSLSPFDFPVKYSPRGTVVRNDRLMVFMQKVSLRWVIKYKQRCSWRMMNFLSRSIRAFSNDTECFGDIKSFGMQLNWSITSGAVSRGAPVWTKFNAIMIPVGQPQ